jgi:hypothetical protein
MRHALLLIGALGALLFGAAYIASLAEPLLVERAAREVVRLEVERRVGERINDLSNSNIANVARGALAKANVDLDAASKELAAEVPQRVAKAIGDLLTATCECRKRLTEALVKGQQERIISLQQARERLSSLIEASYASVTSNLLREFRIFTASNAAAFAMLLVVTYYRRAAALQLALPAVVLLGAVSLVGTLYIFNHNWLHTVLYSQYVGLGYVAYLGVAGAFLSDVVFNRARVTTSIVNAALQAVGSALHAVPC